MKIGTQQDISRLFQHANEVSSAMPGRIREAYQQGAQSSIPAEKATETAPIQPRDNINAQGAGVRAELERVVLEVLSGEATQSVDVVKQAITLIVDERFDALGLEVDQSLRQAVMDEMSQDPTVVAELDELLQSIARQLPR